MAFALSLLWLLTSVQSWSRPNSCVQIRPKYEAVTSSVARRRRATVLDEGDATAVEREDVSGDGGVVKVRSQGVKTGKRLFTEDGAVARLRYKAFGAGGLLLAKADDMTYTVGDQSWVPGFDLAVRSMTVGESAKFECTSAYAYGDQGVPPAVSAGETISLEVDMVDYRGNLATSTSFAQDKPLTPRTATEIKQEYERRRASKLRAEVSVQDTNEDAGLFAPIKKAMDTFRGFYFFGFFESQTGETPPWYLRPLITFPTIFIFVRVLDPILCHLLPRRSAFQRIGF